MSALTPTKPIQNLSASSGMGSATEAEARSDEIVVCEPVDKAGYDIAYRDEAIGFEGVTTPGDYAAEYERRFARSFSDGGWVFDGDVCAALLEQLEEYVSRNGGDPSRITILDAGSGTGRCSAYFASLGFRVIGIELSTTGVNIASRLRDSLRLNNLEFRNCSLEATDLEAGSVDIFYGRHTLHHFIKYPLVAKEFRRLAKPGALGLFMDPFGENVFKNLFHDKAKMATLGDELLTKRGIERFFQWESVSLTPFHWVSLVDKLLIKIIFGWKRQGLVRKIARATGWLDSRIPKGSRLALWASGLVLTRVQFR